MRAQDPGNRWVEWLDDVAVVCPRCGARARSQRLPSPEGIDKTYGAKDFGPRRLACSICGHVKDWECKEIHLFEEPLDPTSGAPLWFAQNTAKGCVFAFNEQHLQFVRNFIAADLRERPGPPWGNTSYLSRLPRWMKDRRNRELVLQAFERMQNRQ